MEFRNIKTFLCIAEMNSFSKAAEKLGYSQSNVSFQIQQLEQELGVRLFERYGRDGNFCFMPMKWKNSAFRLSPQ